MEKSASKEKGELIFSEEELSCLSHAMDIISEAAEFVDNYSVATTAGDELDDLDILLCKFMSKINRKKFSFDIYD